MFGASSTRAAPAESNSESVIGGRRSIDCTRAYVSADSTVGARIIRRLFASPSRVPLSRIFSRADFLAGVREMTPPLLGLLPFGLVCGVGAQSAGASVWQSFGLSAVMFSGAAQILATQLIASGAPIAVTVLTCFVIGLRFLMYSAAMAPHLKSLPSRWRQALAFLLT